MVSLLVGPVFCIEDTGTCYQNPQNNLCRFVTFTMFAFYWYIESDILGDLQNKEQEGRLGCSASTQTGQ